MNKEEFFNYITECESYYYKNNPCYHCGPGNGCDDCRDCKDSKISHEMWENVHNLKNEYKEKFGADYDKEVEELNKAYREQVRKRNLLKEVWDECSFDEIIDAGFEYNKCSGEQLINAASEFENQEEESDDKSIQDKFEEFLEKHSKDLPWCGDMMSILEDYYHQSSMMDYFDNDDLIEHLDGTYEMDKYIDEELEMKIQEYEDNNPSFTVKEFKEQLYNLQNWEFRRFICEMTDSSYFVSDNELLNKLKDKIK